MKRLFILFILFFPIAVNADAAPSIGFLMTPDAHQENVFHMNGFSDDVTAENFTEQEWFQNYLYADRIVYKNLTSAQLQVLQTVHKNLVDRGIFLCAHSVMIKGDESRAFNCEDAMAYNFILRSLSSLCTLRLEKIAFHKKGHFELANHLLLGLGLSLKSLTFSKCYLDEAFFNTLTSFSFLHLRGLSFSGSRFTNSHLQDFLCRGNLSRLERLNLSNTEITLFHVQFLRFCSFADNLHVLNLSGTNIGRAGINFLEAHFPDVEIYLKDIRDNSVHGRWFEYASSWILDLKRDFKACEVPSCFDEDLRAKHAAVIKAFSKNWFCEDKKEDYETLVQAVRVFVQAFNKFEQQKFGDVENMSNKPAREAPGKDFQYFRNLFSEVILTVEYIHPFIEGLVDESA